MTYNFDPERWYENQRAILDARLARAEISAEEHVRLLEELDLRHDAMVERLDDTYRIPGRE